MKWLGTNLGVHACGRAFFEDPQRAQDYMVYVERGDKNCGCNTALGLTIRSAELCDVYQIKVPVSALRSGCLGGCRCAVVFNEISIA